MLPIPSEVAAILTLAIWWSDSEARVFRAGIQSIDKVQMEAAKSLGMTWLQAIRFVILPLAIRKILLLLGNGLITFLKDFGLLTVRAINEFTQCSHLRRASTFQVMTQLNVTAFLYLFMFPALRRTSISFLLDLSQPEYAVQARAGHSKASVTTDTSSHAMAHLQDTVAERLEKLVTLLKLNCSQN